MKKFLLAITAVTLLASFSDAATSAARKGKAKRRVVVIEDDADETTTASVRQPRSKTAFRAQRVIPAFQLIIANNVGSDSDGLSSKTGIGIGATVDLGKSDFVIETGLMYRMMGTYRDIDSTTLSLSYLTVPINAKYYLMPAQASVSPFVKAGFLPSINIGASSSRPAINGFAAQNGSVNNVNTMDLGFDVGAGVKFNVADSTSILGELNYSRSFTRIFDSFMTYNSAFTIQAGVGIEL